MREHEQAAAGALLPPPALPSDSEDGGDPSHRPTDDELIEESNAQARSLMSARDRGEETEEKTDEETGVWPTNSLPNWLNKSRSRTFLFHPCEALLIRSVKRDH